MTKVLCHLSGRKTGPYPLVYHYKVQLYVDFRIILLYEIDSSLYTWRQGSDNTCQELCAFKVKLNLPEGRILWNKRQQKNERHDSLQKENPQIKSLTRTQRLSSKPTSGVTGGLLPTKIEYFSYLGTFDVMFFG